MADAVLALLDQLGDRLAVHCDRHRLAMTSVNNRRDLAVAAKLLRHFLAGLFAATDFQRDFSHDADSLFLVRQKRVNRWKRWDIPGRRTGSQFSVLSSPCEPDWNSELRTEN